jgi:hypothetical protein
LLSLMMSLRMRYCSFGLSLTAEVRSSLSMGILYHRRRGYARYSWWWNSIIKSCSSRPVLVKLLQENNQPI